MPIWKRLRQNKKAHKIKGYNELFTHSISPIKIPSKQYHLTI